VKGTDKFYLSLLGWSLAMMHVIDVLLDSFTRLFRHQRYSPLEKLYCSMGLGITYFHETFGNRNKIERWFRELKNRTKRFHNNVNSKTLKSIEEIATAVAIVHNLVRIGRREVILT
jgi:transposase-like protein